MPKETKKAKVLEKHVHVPAPKKQNGLKKPEKHVHGKVEQKQAPVIAALAKNIGNVGKHKTTTNIVKDAGYSESYALSGHIKDTKAFRSKLNVYFPDDELMEQTKQLMNASTVEHYSFPLELEDDTIRGIIEDFGLKCVWIAKAATGKRAYFPVFNATAKKDALNMIFKLKKYYDDELTVNHTGLRELSSEELRARIAGIVSGAIGSLARGKQKNTPVSG